MSKKADGCVQPAGGPISSATADASPETPFPERKPIMMARVGHQAPDFEASAYVNGGFENIKLSDYKGQWVTLCFYPGDFTFV